ncbi:AAA family ATPase [Pseudaestuariivita sp.]|uniref:AAA family ATPase n=1 Tax=Pseudaestuariivita sp. TaxID=2211669 RepID=UPI0040589B75
MTQAEQLYNNVAPLRNVAALCQLIERVQNRDFSLPGMACFYGFSGYGKTSAATFASVKYGCISVQVADSWSRKKLCQAILAEMGIKPRGLVYDMMDQIKEWLAIQDVPLLLDDADLLIRKGMIETTREIYEGSGASIILIGEEELPQNLARVERIHGRMLDWVAAQPADASDVDHLADLYAAGVTVSQELKTKILEQARGSLRRIAVNLATCKEIGATKGIEAIGLDDWGKRQFFTGNAPTARRGAA